MKKKIKMYALITICSLLILILQSPNVFAAAKTLGVVSVREGGYRIQSKYQGYMEISK